MTVRSVLAFVGFALLALVASLMLHRWLLGGIGPIAWLLCGLAVYAGATVLMLRGTAGLRPVRSTVAFGVVGALLKVGLSGWLLLDSEAFRLMREEMGTPSDAWPMLLLLLPGLLSEVLAPIGGAFLGWFLWRRSSRIEFPETA